MSDFFRRVEDLKHDQIVQTASQKSQAIADLLNGCQHVGDQNDEPSFAKSLSHVFHGDARFRVES